MTQVREGSALADRRGYRADARVTVYPFSQFAEGEEIIIGNATHSSFLSLPRKAVGILTALAQGHTVAEAQQRYEEQDGETPDIEAFLELLEREGFLSTPAPAGMDSLAAASRRTPSRSATARGTTGNHHFDSISLETARRITSRPVRIACVLAVCLGIALVALDPGVLPRASAMVFRQSSVLVSVAFLAFIVCTAFLHEMAHLVAARAAGAQARLAVSHRLWVLVAETDMSGVWLVPKSQRYLAFLAGPLLDAVFASMLICVLFGVRRGWVSLASTAAQLCEATLLLFLLRLVWQCFLFVRTDLYYVLSTLFNCKSLMRDTQTFLRNQLARVARPIRTVDQSNIPSSEMRVIRCYALVWLAGRGVAFLTLFTITLPVLWGYGVETTRVLFSGGAEGAGGLLWIWIVAGFQLAGLVLWLRGLHFARR